MAIGVSYEKLRSSASDLRAKEARIRSVLDNITAAMNRTRDNWQSGAGESMRSQYAAVSGKYADFEAALLTYAKFLDDAANTYETLDNQNKAQMEALQTDYNG